MSWFGDKIRAKVRRRLQTQAPEILQRNRQGTDQGSYLGSLSADRKTVQLPDGRTFNAVIGGNPEAIDSTVILNQKDALIYKDKINVLGGGKIGGGFVLLAPLSGTNAASPYFYVKNIKDADNMVYQLSATAISGCGPNAALITIAFSPNGKNIFVGTTDYVQTATDGKGNPVYSALLKWGYVKNFGLKPGVLPDNSDGVVTGSVVQGSLVYRDPQTVALDPPQFIPSPLSYSDTHYCTAPCGSPYCSGSGVGTGTTTTINNVYTDPYLNQFDAESYSLQGNYILGNKSDGSPIIDFVGITDNSKSNSTYLLGGSITGRCDATSTSDMSCMCGPVIGRTYSGFTAVLGGSDATIVSPISIVNGSPKYDWTFNTSNYQICNSACCAVSVNNNYSYTITENVIIGGQYRTASEKSCEVAITNLQSNTPLIIAKTAFTSSVNYTNYVPPQGGVGSGVGVVSYTGFSAVIAEAFRANQVSTEDPNTANVQQQTTSSGVTTTFYDHPYIAAGASESSYPFVVTDTHVLYNTQSDWSTPGMLVKATGSEIFQSCLRGSSSVHTSLAGTVTLSKYSWSTATSNIVKGDILHGTFDMSLYSILDYIMV